MSKREREREGGCRAVFRCKPGSMLLHSPLLPSLLLFLLRVCRRTTVPHFSTPALTNPPSSLYPSFSFASSSSSGRGDALPVPHFFAPTRAPQGLGSAAPIRGPFVGRRAAGHGHIRPLQVRTGILASFPRRCVWKVVEEGDGGRGISVLVLALFGLTENWNYCRLSVARPPFVRQAEA